MSTILLPKTQHLVVFQEVIRSGSIGSAAKELGLTQPAVSKIINDIEDYFGVELVVRKNTGVTLTPAGQLLLSRSESITREMKNMVNEISGMSSEAVVPVEETLPVAQYAAVWSKNYRIKKAASVLVELAKEYSSYNGCRRRQLIEVG